MISGEKIAAYIAQPQEIVSDDLDDLAALSEKYPYCSSLYILELKGLALANDLNFESQLRKTSIHAHDRQHLYALIHTEETHGEEEFAENELLPSVKENEQPEPAEVLIPEETPPAVIIKTESAQTSVIPEISDQIIKEESTEGHLQALEDDLSVDILTNAIDIAFVETEVSRKEELPIDTETQPEEVPEIEQKPAKVIAEANKTIPEQELSFIEWLRLKQQKPASTETIKTAVPAENKTLKTPTKKPKPNDVNALLDRFIKDEPRISKPVKDFYNPAKSAKKSLEESDDLITETLAKIHVMQRNYSKAISAYEKLILLYPEKKTFFASQIEKIKRKNI